MKTHKMKNKYQKNFLQTIKDQSKQKVQNVSSWSATRENTYRDHLWKIYALVT